MRCIILVAAFALFGCQKDESLSAYGAGGSDWRLISLNGTAFPAEAVLRFPKSGQISGTAPCNSFTARQTAPYPWFALDSLAVTRRTCLAQTDEAVFLNALQSMTLSEVSGDILVLSDDQGHMLEFTRQPPDAPTGQ